MVILGILLGERSLDAIFEDYDRRSGDSGDAPVGLLHKTIPIRCRLGIAP